MTVIPFDPEFRDRKELNRFLREFAHKPASWRKGFISRFAALPLDDGDREFLSIITELDFGLTQIKKD